MSSQFISRRSRDWLQALGLATLALWLVVGTPAQATISRDTPFELDADPTDNIDVPESDDWNTPPTSGGAIRFTGILQDKAPRSVFSGGDKDTLDVSDWGWKDGSVPDKDDLTHAYAAAYNEEGELLVYFGADRYSNVGDAYIGFWFFKQKIHAEPGGHFSGVHSKGDTLVLINFPQGANDAPNLAVVEWDTSCRNGSKDPDCVAPNLRLLLQKEGAIGGNDVCGEELYCAVTNAGEVAIPDMETEPSGKWSDYVPKSGNPGVFPAESFFEGGINLSRILGDSDGCFSSFMAETRSSSSFTASLKDFVLGSFELCGIEITKTCTDGDLNDDETGFKFSFAGTVTNTGFGAVYDVVIMDDNGTPNNANDDFIAAEFESIPKGESVNYSGNFESSGNGPTNTVYAKAASRDGSEQTITASAIALCPTVDRDPAIDVTKSCQSKVDWEEVAGKLVLRVDYGGKVCNTTGMGEGEDYIPGISLKNVTVKDEPSGNIHNIGTLAPATCQDYAGSYYPTSSGNKANPADVSFSDTVTATGTAPLGFGTATETASATCPLCPTCPDCAK